MTLVALAALFGVWMGDGHGRGWPIISGIAMAIGLAATVVVGSHLRVPAPNDRVAGTWRTRCRDDGETRGWRTTWVVLSLIMITGYARSNHEWTMVAAVRLGPYEGDAVIVSDPRSVGRATQAILEIDGQRFDVWSYGSVGTRLSRRVAGEAVRVSGERRLLAPGSARRRQIHHVVGRFDVRSMGSVATGPLSRASPILVAAYRIRTMLEDGSRTLSPNEATLFAGLVYGDDSDQPAEMTDRFRRSGLAHLTAVSGQNVAYLMALVSPLLTRLRRPVRWGASLVVVGWFTVLTRLEPSVIRAGLMAAVAATVFALGKQASSRSVLGMAVTVGLLVDPFLAWSVGWWLSVCGTAGLIVTTPILVRSVPTGPPWLVQWAAPMLGAQIGILPVSLMVFGAPNALSIPCNLLAVPVAGVVMLIGLPAALVAGWLPRPLARLMMWPLGLGVHWVDTVAALGSRLRPPTPVNQVVVAVAIAIVLGAAWRSRHDVTT